VGGKDFFGYFLGHKKVTICWLDVLILCHSREGGNPGLNDPTPLSFLPRIMCGVNSSGNPSLSWMPVPRSVSGTGSAGMTSRPPGRPVGAFSLHFQIKSDILKAEQQQRMPQCPYMMSCWSAASSGS
jgi:hypothetical protein